MSILGHIASLRTRKKVYRSIVRRLHEGVDIQLLVQQYGVSVQAIHVLDAQHAAGVWK